MIEYAAMWRGRGKLTQLSEEDGFYNGLGTKYADFQQKISMRSFCYWILVHVVPV